MISLKQIKIKVKLQHGKECFQATFLKYSQFLSSIDDNYLIIRKKSLLLPDVLKAPMNKTDAHSL